MPPNVMPKATTDACRTLSDARHQRPHCGTPHARIDVALHHFIQCRRASADQADAEQRVERSPREQPTRRILAAAKKTPHHAVITIKRGHARLDQFGVVASECAESFARNGQRLRSGAHAITAFWEQR